MPRPATTPWPTGPGSFFLSSAAPAGVIQRALRAGRIRRLAHGLYTADLTAAPHDLMRDNRWAIVAALMPDAVVADRTAANDGQPVDGVIHVVSNRRARDLLLPGLVVTPRKGAAPLPDDPPWAGGLRITSDARTLVDNLAISRARAGRTARTLSRAELGDWLVRKSRLRPAGWLEQLRSRAVELAEELGVPERQAEIEELIGRVAGTRPVGEGAGILLRVRAAGVEWDARRLEQFGRLVEQLQSPALMADVPHALPAPPGDGGGVLPFYEAYFSNFIEGTEFSIDEARRIVEQGEIPAARPEDAHDVQGTHRVVSDPVDRATVAATVEQFIELLRRRHRFIMAGRPELRPGEFKLRPNQAGSYVFVEPELVVGTLTEGFRLVDALPSGFPRAAYQLFMVSEVHPFDDGNGRVARAFMNAELSASGQARIVVPIVHREEYMTALRVLSRDGRADLFIRVLVHAWRWTAGMPWHDRVAVEGRMEATHALVDSTDAARLGLRLQLP